MIAAVFVSLSVRVRVSVRDAIGVGVRVLEADVELHAGNVGLLPAGDMDMPAVEFEFFEFVFQRARIDAEINQRAEEHVAADAAENVQIKRFHL